MYNTQYLKNPKFITALFIGILLILNLLVDTWCCNPHFIDYYLLYSVFRPVLATQMSVLPTVFKILNGESCTGGEASLPLSVTLLSEAGANCTFTAPSSPLSPGSLTAVSDLGECAFTDFTNGINRKEAFTQI